MHMPKPPIMLGKYEPRHDKTNKASVRPAKTQISLGNRPVWSESSLSAWRNLGSLATHWAHSKDSDKTGRMPRVIWVFAGRTLTLLVLSCRGSIIVFTTACTETASDLYLRISEAKYFIIWLRQAYPPIFRSKTFKVYRIVCANNFLHIVITLCMALLQIAS